MGSVDQHDNTAKTEQKLQKRLLDLANQKILTRDICDRIRPTGSQHPRMYGLPKTHIEDTVNHGILLQKLELYGIQDKVLKWFCSYLTKRRQCCKVNGKLSKIESTTCGVPQGSCLGPLLFIIYINDLHLHMKHCEVNMYADDTSLMFASDSITQINDFVNDDLSNLKSWLQANKLSLNVAKTHSLVIGSRKRLKDISDDRVAKPSFMVGKENVSIVENTKYLGVIVDKCLSWDE